MPSQARPYLLLFLLLAGAAGLLWLTAPERRPAPAPEAPPRVETAAVRLADLRPEERVTGVLAPARRAVLRFELSGRVRERRVEPGRRVEAGEALLALEDGDLRDALARAEAALELERAAAERDRRLLELAEEAARLQRREVERLRRLEGGDLAPASALEEARRRLLQLEGEVVRLRQQVATAPARLRRLEAERSRARRDLERAVLRAPFAGTVAAVGLDVGERATPAAAAVTLVEAERLRLRLQAGPEAARSLALGREVAVEAGGRRLRGRVVALGPEPEAGSATYPVEVELPGEGLLPGEAATARLTLPPLRAVPVVPEAALVREGGRAYVVVVEGGRARRRPVRPGPREGALRAVLEGLAGGERVVVRDAAALGDGVAVVAVPAEGAAEGGTAEGVGDDGGDGARR